MLHASKNAPLVSGVRPNAIVPAQWVVGTARIFQAKEWSEVPSPEDHIRN